MPGKYSIPEFAAEIKRKYPEYNDWEDGYLVGELTSKYPEYKDWVEVAPPPQAAPIISNPTPEPPSPYTPIGLQPLPPPMEYTPMPQQPAAPVVPREKPTVSDLLKWMLEPPKPKGNMVAQPKGDLLMRLLAKHEQKKKQARQEQAEKAEQERRVKHDEQFNKQLDEIAEANKLVETDEELNKAKEALKYMQEEIYKWKDKEHLLPEEGKKILDTIKEDAVKARAYINTREQAMKAEPSHEAEALKHETPAFEREKTDYEIYKDQYKEYQKSQLQSGNVPRGSGVEYDPSNYGVSLIGTKQPMTPQQFALYKAGKKDVTMSNVWFPEDKDLKKSTAFEDFGSIIGGASSALMQPLTSALTLRDENTNFKAAAEITENAKEEKQKEDIKKRIAEAKELGLPQNEEDVKALAELDPTAWQSFKQGIKDVKELAFQMAYDPEVAKDFVRDFIEMAPAYMAASGGIGAFGAVAKTAGSMLRAAHKAKQIARKFERLQKAKGAVVAKRYLEEAMNVREFETGRANLKELTTTNPMAARQLAKSLAKMAAVDETAMSVIDTATEAAKGNEASISNYARNLAANLLSDGVLFVLGHGAAKLKHAAENPNANPATPAEFDNVWGDEGNIKYEAKTRGREAIDTFAQRPDRVAEIKELSNKRTNNLTSEQQYRFIDEMPEDTKEAASKQNAKQVFGFRDKNDINNITPIGHTGTITHETLHGLENRLFKETPEPEGTVDKMQWEEERQLADDLRTWKAQAKQWAKDNNQTIPSDRELVAQTFAHRLGYKEPASEVVDKIPVPDELLRKMAKAASADKNRLLLRGETMPELRQEQKYYSDDGEELPFSLTEKPKPSMEEARQNVPEEKRRWLNNVWNSAIAGKGRANRPVYFNKPNKKLNAEVSRVFGKEINIDNQSVTLGYVRHINNYHGVDSPYLGKDEIPVTKDVFALIPDVLENFDTIEKSNKQTTRGEDAIKITKHYSDGTMTIVDAVVKIDDPKKPNKANLEIRTVYVDKSKESAVATNYSSAARKGVYRTNPATHNIQKNPPPSNVSREKSGDKVRFSLAETAGVPENHSKASDIAKQAKKEWQEKGVESRFFKRWFGDSKVVDEDGKPMVVYHGTNAEFNTFDTRYIGSNVGGRLDYGIGFYFTSGGALDSSPSWYGDKVGSYYLKLENPFIVSKNDVELGKALLKLDKNIHTKQGEKISDRLAEGLQILMRDIGPDTLTELLKSNGFDGVISGREYVAFYPEQIKSATDNRGTFDGENPDIRFSLSPKERAIADNDPNRKVYIATRNFLNKDVGVHIGDIDTLFEKADKKWHEQRKKAAAGMKTEFSPELDKLAERLAEDPDIAALIGYHTDEAGAMDRIREIASDYGRLHDDQRVSRGQAAQNGYSYDDEYLNSPEAVNENFNYQLEDQINGDLPKDHIYNLGRPRQILLNAGIPDLPIELKADVLALKASQNYGHPFELSEIKDLPNAINDPIAIFAYGDKEKAVNVITEIQSNGKNFLVGIALNPKVKGKALDIHSIRTIFPKDVPEWKNWIDQGKALYVNEEKLGSLNNPRNPEDVSSNPTNKYTKNSPDVQEETAKKAAEGEKSTQNSTNEVKGEQQEAFPARKIEMPHEGKEESAFRKKIREYQDEMIMYKDLDDMLQTEASVYDAADLSFGKVSNEIREAMKDVKEISDIVKKHKLDFNFVEDFTESLHTKERNAQIKKEYNKENGSGHSDEWADEQREKFLGMTATEQKAIKDIVNAIRKTTKSILNDLVESGLMSMAERERLEKLYPNYVPLRNLPKEVSDLLIRGHGGGEKGFMVHPDNKKAKGRKSAAENIISQVFARKQDSIVRANKNMVLREFHKQYLEANNKYGHDKSFWELDPPDNAPAGNDFSFYIDGKEHTMRLYTHEGKRMVEALMNLDKDNAGDLVNFIGKITGFKRDMITKYSPLFIPKNAIRDYQHAVLMGFVRYGSKDAAKILKRTIPNMFKLFANDLGIKKNEAAKWRDRWREAGGEMGYITQISHEKRTESLVKEIDFLRKGKYDPRTYGRKFLEFWEHANEIIEGNVRQVVFQTLVEGGMSDRQAARASKDITVNFNRFGSKGRSMNKLYHFANAKIQGIDNYFSAFKDKDPAVRRRAKQAAVAWAGMGFINGILNHWGKAAAIAGITLWATGEEQDNDKDKYANIPEWQKRMNMIIPMPWSKEHYGKIPMAQESNVIFNIGTRLATMMMEDDYSALDLLSGTVADMIDMGNPIGSELNPDAPGKSLVKTLTPSIGEPIVDVVLNEDFTGKKITPDNAPGDKKPAALRYRENVIPFFRDAAAMLNELSGGSTEFEDGGFTQFLSPHDMQYVIGQYLGGIGNLVQKGWGIAYAKAQGEDVDIAQYPAVDIVAGRISPSGDKHEMYDTDSEAAYALKKYNEWDRNENTEEKAAIYLDRKYGLIRYGEALAEIKRYYADSRKDKKELKTNDDKKEYKEITKKITDFEDEFGHIKTKTWNKIQKTENKAEIDELLDEMLDEGSKLLDKYGL